MKVIIITLFVFALAYGQSTDDDTPTGTPVPQDATFNDNLDKEIKKILDDNQELISPYKLEEKKVSFQRKVFMVNVTGAIGFENITLHGLQNIKRSGNSDLVKTKYGNIEMTTRLSIGPLSLKADGVVSFLGLSSKSSYELNLENVETSAVLHFYTKTEEVYVKSFSMGKLNGLQFKITKSPLVFTPFVVNQITRATVAVYSPLIRFAVEKAASRVLMASVKDSEYIKDIMTKYAK